MMVISKSAPTTSRRCFNQVEAAWLARMLVTSSVSFYCEPEPDDIYLFIVNEEVGHVIDKLIHDGGLAKEKQR